MARTQDDYARVFQPLGETFNQIGELGRRGPAVGSEAARDGQTELGQLAWVLAQAAAAVGLDHLVTWQVLRLECSSQPSFAHLTLIRSAIEGMVVARWLCDPNIDTRQRVQRAAGVQAADYKERLRFEREIARPTEAIGDSRTAEQRIEEFQELLSRDDVKPIEMPNATELFAWYVQPAGSAQGVGESVFRVLSSIAHAKVWSLHAISELGEVSSYERGQAVTTTASDEVGLAMTAAAMLVAADVLADLRQYASPATDAGH